MTSTPAAMVTTATPARCAMSTLHTVTTPTVAHSAALTSDALLQQVDDGPVVLRVELPCPVSAARQHRVQVGGTERPGMVVTASCHVDVALGVGLEAELARVDQHTLQEHLLRRQQGAEERDGFRVIPGEVASVMHAGGGQGAEEPAAVTDELVAEHGAAAGQPDRREGQAQPCPRLDQVERHQRAQPALLRGRGLAEPPVPVLGP